LEDDCLPGEDFFIFCESLLTRYKCDERVWAITGDNFQSGKRRGFGSYYFSRYNHAWGWATWRRAWSKFDPRLSFWPRWRRSSEWKKEVGDRVERRYWENIFDRVYNREMESAWDYPWTATVWFYGGLTATPNVNLVSNIGFGPDATHTARADSPLAGMETSALGEVTHPACVVQDQAADRYVFDHTFGGKSLRFPGSLLRLPGRAGGFLWRRLKRSFA